MEETSWPKLAFFLLHDCARCLALARQQQLACPAPHLSGDQFALNAVGISAAVPPTVLGDFCVALLQAGGWIRPARVREAHVWELTPAAHTWLAQPAPLQLQALREVWWRHLATADQALPALAFPEAVARRWQAVARAWYAWSAQLPLDSWTSQATVKVHLRRLGLYHIPVPWENLAHVPPAIIHSLERLNAWLGQGVLLWLGFLECRNSNAGPEYRPLAEGQAWLRAALNDQRFFRDKLPFPANHATMKKLLSSALCMEATMTDLTPFQTEVLCLLIGGNPLPDYVSAILLARPGARVYLLHTSATLEFAQRLAQALAQPRPDITCTPIEISKADPQQIERRLQSLIREWGPNTSIGLNYTGGSKPMAAQAYHSLSQAYPRGTFSYLDADTLSLILAAPGMPVQQYPIGQQVRVSLATLLGLHGYAITGQRSPGLPPALRQALVRVHSDREGCNQYRAWLLTFGQGAPQLPVMEQFPTLAPVLQAFEALCAPAPATPENVARALGFKNGQLGSCTKVLAADWLEEHAYTALQTLAPQLGLHEIGLGLQVQGSATRNFEFDVTAVLGYQLFAVSCIASDRSQNAKDHLMETFVRARQFGGDEARAALVCCLENPAEMEQEITQGWGAEDKIRVFGRSHLPDLAAHFYEWIIKAARLR